jgi:hypothetical protein
MQCFKFLLNFNNEGLELSTAPMYAVREGVLANACHNTHTHTQIKLNHIQII